MTDIRPFCFGRTSQPFLLTFCVAALGHSTLDLPPLHIISTSKLLLLWFPTEKMPTPSCTSSQLAILLLLAFAASVTSHPNCVQPVDGHVFPPKPNPPLAYCSEYGTNSDGACCTAVSELTLARAPAQTVINFASTDAATVTCSSYVKNIYCTWCNPYSGHNYESETGNGPRPGPWLCTAFCGHFWQACSTVPMNASGPATVGSSMKIPGLVDGMGVTTLADHFDSVDDYCAIYGSGNPGSCYTDDPEELVTIPGGAAISMVTELAYPNLAFNGATVPLQNPAWYIHITHLLVAPGSKRMFGSFQHGVILSWEDSEDVDAFNTVIDLQSSTYFDNGGGSEYGVMGVGFHPNFATNGWMYVKHSYLADHDRLIRVTVDRTTWIADPASMIVIFDYQMFGVMHHGSPPIFGADGLMYMANGDGTNYETNGVAYNPAQDPASLLGKVLRVNVDASTAAQPYAIPADNPFVNTAGWAPEVWAWGFRNPWRLTFDATEGRFWLGNVGQSMFEGVYVVEGGKFHGWHKRESFNCYYPTTSLIGAPFTDCATDDEVLPILEFPHDASYCAIESLPAHCAWPSIIGNAVIGGYVYRGAKNPSIWGTYIFAIYQPDYSAYVYTVNYDTNDPSNVFSVWRIAPIYPAGHDNNNWSISTLGLDSDGELLVVNINNANEILKFAPDGTPAPPGSVPVPTPTTPNTTPSKAPTKAPSAPSPVTPNTPTKAPIASPSTAPSTPKAAPTLTPSNAVQKPPTSGGMDHAPIWPFVVFAMFCIAICWF